MSVYVDTNILVHLYLDLDGTGRARDLLYEGGTRKRWPLPVTDLSKCEVTNAFQRLVFESQSGGQWRITPEAAAASQAFFESHLDQKSFLCPSPLSMGDVEPVFRELSLRHTARHGFRTYDIMHVASALTLTCTRFYSFDRNAKKLARLEGLETN